MIPLTLPSLDDDKPPGVVIGHPAQEDPNPRPEDCGCPYCLEMHADLVQRGRELAARRRPDDSDLEHEEAFP